MIQSYLLPADLPAERVAACIGLISDTHMPQRWPTLPPVLFEVLRGVDLVLHAGDVGELWVLDQLSQIAPVIAVHGNDETKEAQRELPYQQVIAVAGQRILLWHSHYPDRIDELESRKDNQLLPKLARSIERARRAQAKVVVFGHWHIPLVYREEEVLVINPGAIASGNGLARQLHQTVALLWLRDDGSPFVSHIDLAAPDRIFDPQIDWRAGFQNAYTRYNASIISPQLEQNSAYLGQQLERFGWEVALPIYLRVAHRVWAGEQVEVTLEDWLAEVRGDEDLARQHKAEYERILLGIKK